MFLSLPLEQVLASCAGPVSLLVTGLLLVGCGAWAAPSNRAITAILLCLTGTAFAAWLFRHQQALTPVVGICLGGLAASTHIAWRTNPRRTRRSAGYIGIGLAVLILGFIGLAYTDHIDWFARPAPLPSRLRPIADAHPEQFKKFSRYHLRGGLASGQDLWRIDTTANVVTNLVNELRMQAVTTVPPRFWQMPPHWWPHSPPVDIEVFQTQHFPADEHDADGEYYLMVYDRTRGKAYLWVKVGM